ncbi:receptor subunit 1 [Seminavis robusta]|uniref:Receptor subunit 1 n=1 Tax=Seminavis robusta TaxID=568900 RepID=A0A9N8E1L8_9STRA|nr:receptor subunit 1 [Seminavis robusta]|eukprot:Sro557_g166130.1 receptor subunit 1 (697) ;mRNA; r:25738-28011
MKPPSFCGRKWLSLAALLCSFPKLALGMGGEKAYYSTSPFDQNSNITHRQNVCARAALYHDGKIELRDALAGMSIRPLLGRGLYFSYTNENGIDPENPGILADLMDSLAERANFTWRNSFGVGNDPAYYNLTWTEMLLWGVETFDIAVDWWDHSVARMEKGVSYIEPWFDGSIILIHKEEAVFDGHVSTVNIWNWTKPFEVPVWIVTVMTVLVSALVFQLIEHLNGERDDRPMRQWFSDNMYLSWLNFTQNYEYAPRSIAGRMFGISMSIWALVMTATYTANLASLFVEENMQQDTVDSIEKAVTLGIPVCTFAGTNSDAFIRDMYMNAVRVPKQDELEVYQALVRGECGLAAAYKDGWLTYQGSKLYNPHCDLAWVGRTVRVIKSGFAVKADAGEYCSTLIRDVINLHLVELISDGVLADAWKKHRSLRQTNNCENLDGSTSTLANSLRRRRRLKMRSQELEVPVTSLTSSMHRVLKKGGASSGSIQSDNQATTALSLEQMLGTFLLHWGTMVLSLLFSVAAYYYKQRAPRKDLEELRYRNHGPVIGMSPPINTYVVKNSEGKPLVPGKLATPDKRRFFESTGTRETWSDENESGDNGAILEFLEPRASELQAAWLRESVLLQRQQHAFDRKLEGMGDRMGMVEDRMEIMIGLLQQISRQQQLQYGHGQQQQSHDMLWLSKSSCPKRPKFHPPTV